MQAGDVLIGIGQFAQNFSDIRGAEESAGEFVGDKVTTGLAISRRIAETDADAAESNMLGPPTAAPARPRRCEIHTGEHPTGGATSTVVDADADIDPALAE